MVPVPVLGMMVEYEVGRVRRVDNDEVEVCNATQGKGKGVRLTYAFDPVCGKDSS
jgi:hypothetical protein